jgi:hypothetical protein
MSESKERNKLNSVVMKITFSNTLTNILVILEDFYIKTCSINYTLKFFNI